MNRISEKLTMLALVVGLTAGESAVAKPRVDTTASSDKMSYDGLYPVKGTRVSMAWARGDLDLTGYDKFWLQGAGIHYRPTKASAGSRYAGRTGKTDFPISEKNRERLQKEFQSALLDELGKSDRIELVMEPGPNVLIVRGALLDVASHVPPEPAGRGGVYIETLGEATMVIELADSESNAILVRAADRRAVEQTGVVREVNRVTSLAEVRRLARHWARLIRSRLEDVLDDMFPVSG